ncbi:type II toxin-antitoxin system RelE/ParE family toxin [Catenovulum sediminis]|uniref:type II toxin-antitoxin system RelE/ParE family toxin n=1 Tax=Catenovulum sediminis TaxID=1740262 RepID=UPI00117FD799|nr:type II toxin-antitoxin system RelE/ParE family toxin [Catenovulum sediminis]
MSKYKIIFALEAKQDLIEIQNYIYEDSQSLAIADNFVLDLFQTLTGSLPSFPFKHPVYKRNIRKFVFPEHTHYCAYFKVDEVQSQIIVLAITNTSQYTRYRDL